MMRGILFTAAVLSALSLASGCDITATTDGEPTADQNDQANDADGQPSTEGVIALWDFEPVVAIPVGSREPAEVAAHVTASTFTSSDGSPSTTVSGPVYWLTENGWFDANTYLSCTLQADDGYEIQSLTLEFDQAALADSGPSTWALRSSADGFATDLATGDVSIYPDYAPHMIDLTGITIGTTAVEFRWIGAGTPSGSNVSWGLDNVTFSGEVLPAS